MWNYVYEVPEQKRVRMIVHTDCKNEADDQYAVAHHLMTPKFDVKAIIAGHFERGFNNYGEGMTVQASYDEIIKVMQCMGVEGSVPVLKGGTKPLDDEHTPVISEGAKFIVEEAMREDSRPLYVAAQGSITDIAAAILMEPAICKRMTVIWIGGGQWPEGGFEFNLLQDRHAANVVFSSEVAVWQVPMNAYKQVAVSLAELQHRVYPYGEIGKYLFEQMAAFNMRCADIPQWPHGEIWGLGDQATISVLMEEQERKDRYDMKEAPYVDEELNYVHGKGYRPIRVYHTIDARLTMEDFYAKLAINFPKNN